MSILSSLIACFYIVYPTPSKNAFMIILIAYSLAVSYVDALAEGISSIVTKLNERIAILEAMKEGGGGKTSDESAKVFGLFNSFRGILQGTMTLVGGYIVQVTNKSHLRVTGIILAAYPIIFCLQTHFIFKEKKVRKKKKMLKMSSDLTRKLYFSQDVATSKWA